MIINMKYYDVTFGNKKPLDILSSIIYLKYGIESKLCNEKEYYKIFTKYNCNSWYTRNEDITKLIKETYLVFKNEEPYLDYKKYGTLFYNTGKLILTAININSENTINKDIYNCFIKNYSIIEGILNSYSNITYQNFQKILTEFSKDKVNFSFSPVLNIEAYFKENIKALNHAEILAVINTGIFYSILGSLFGILNTQQINELFNYGEDVESVSGSGIMNHIDKEYKIEPEKIYNLYMFSGIYDLLTTYLEKSIGIKFNDRFSIVIRAIGNEFIKLYDKEFNITEETDFKEIVFNNNLPVIDRIFSLIREIINPVSNLYVGDHSYDFRPMYIKYLYNKNKIYYPPMVELLKYANNFDYSNIINYTSIIDAHAYERLIKSILIHHYNIYGKSESTNKDYVISWFKLRYLERYLDKIYKYWINSKTPLKIEGVDPMYVPVETNAGVAIKDEVPIEKVQYSIAIERTIDILDSLNARYCEAVEMYFNLKMNELKFDSDFHSKTEKLIYDDYTYDNIESAIRENQIGKRPYLVSIGMYDDKLLNKIALNNPVDMEKIKKLAIVDSKYNDSTRSFYRSPYDIMKTDSFNYQLLEGEIGEKIASDLTYIIKSLSNYEHLYISIR